MGAGKERCAHTVCWPSEAAGFAIGIHAIDASDLEPDIASSFERVDIFAFRDLSHVELHRAGMCHSLVGHETERTAGGYGGTSRAGTHLEAADVGTVDVRNAMIVLVIFSHSNRRPLLCLGFSIDDELGESIWFGFSKDLGIQE